MVNQVDALSNFQSFSMPYLYWPKPQADNLYRSKNSSFNLDLLNHPQIW
jgi:hypothetical protein